MDPTCSFIVQAPAGSGKTGLLIQRYLTLLASVDHPEEVVAVTFTRKAAGEMRERILMALADAEARDREETAEGPDNNTSLSQEETAEEHRPARHPFQRGTRALARKVLARDAARGWDIRAYPARLRIRTIDALCAAIVRMAPWRSRLGGEARTVEDAESLYREAARELLEILDHPGPWADALARVLDFLDNDLTRFETGLVRMLARRDQWLRHLVQEGDPAEEAPADRRRRIGAAFEIAVAEALARPQASVPASLAGTIVAVADHAGRYLSAIDPDSPIAVLAGLDALPGDEMAALPLWRGMAALLLTQEGKWRSRHTRKEGFPPAREAKTAPDMKKTLAGLMSDLSQAETFRHQLHAVRELPTALHDDRQWAVLDALMTVLRLAAATLRLVFARQGVVDFIEVAHGALAALGDDEAPTDLALCLDYRIRHLLVDEFQDTAQAQVRLFTRLTAGWQPGDGRTLFLVGDPMQSIYRFREADVALYLHARRFGIGDIPLEPLTLTANFRSEPPIVDWINRTFPLVFPDTDDVAAGAVSFSPSSAAPRTTGNDAPALPEETMAGRCRGRHGVCIHPYRQGEDRQEADRVVALIRAAREEDPTGTIALIVRARTHLDAILPRLDAQRIPYRGVELSPLIHRPVVRDLLALTRALLHPGDRIAWLAVLRAPWCGLTLGDLHALAAGDHEAPILERLRAVLDANSNTSGEPAPGPDGTPPVHAPLSADGRGRLERVFRVLDNAVRQRARRSLRTVVETAWLALGGAACLTTPPSRRGYAIPTKAGPGPDAGEDENTGETDDRSDAMTFLALLEELEAEAEPMDGHRVAEKISRRYATSGPDPGQVEIMTIHKAKGLEFDTVIVPGLGRAARPVENPLLAWAERPGTGGEAHPMLATMAGPGEADSPTYRYLCALEAEKARHETARLLYVATTRARKRLHLLGQARVSEKTGQVRTPHAGTLLAHLWPAVSSRFTDAGAQNGDEAPTVTEAFASDPVVRGTLWRLPADWQPPQPPTPPRWSSDHLSDAASPPAEPIEFQWAGHVARSVGTVIHQALRYLAESGRCPGEGGKADDATVDPTNDPLPWLQGKRAAWRAALVGLGVSEAALEPAVARVMAAMGRVMADPRWRWITDPTHTDARNEYPLTGVVTGRLVSGVIDRTFVDGAGVRWIIDYKTGTHEGGDPDRFLDREQTRYRAQLERYAALLAGEASRPIRAGLYFPLLGGWRTWRVVRRPYFGLSANG